MTCATSSPESGICDPDFDAIARCVIGRTGLAYYEQRRDELAQRIEVRMAQLGFKRYDQYADLLHDAARSAAEIDELARLLTIGETHFFRHGGLIDALRHHVLPELLQRRAATKRLRIWSAGCSIGAEPYTLAILLRKYLAASTVGWRIEIFGTDINRNFLAQAAEGRFAEWALRGVDDHMRYTCFTADGSHWRIKDELKRDVCIAYHNLMSPEPIDTGFDLVLCRNVFIYFSNEVIREVVERLRSSLVDDGFLAVGHSEISPFLFEGFRAIRYGNAVVYGLSDTPRDAPQWQPPVLDIAPMPLILATDLPREPDNPIDCNADIGNLDEAIEQCRRAILADRLNPHAYVRQAMLLEQQARLDEAMCAVKQALYLDHRAAFAHYIFASIALRRDEVDAAARALRNVVDLLDGRADDEPVEYGDGVTIAELRRLLDSYKEVAA